MQPEVATHLGAQLPLLVRGLYYEDWHIHANPRASQGRVLAPIAAAFRRDPEVDPEQVARAVLATLAENIDPGQVSKIVDVLPRGLRELWPQPATLSRA